MPRIPRAIAPGLPHHVTQRGNRRQQTFFGPDDYRLYLALMDEWCDRCGVEVWAYCLMPNHVHLVAVPESAEGLRRAVGEAHRRYTATVNQREGWSGHLWQGRFASCAMDERHLLAAARYVELNPVRAGLVARAGDYRWSSARAHLRCRDDALAKVTPLLALVGRDWSAFLRENEGGGFEEDLRRHESTGRPLGDEEFVLQLERTLGRRLRPHRRGRRPRGERAADDGCELSMVSPN